MDPECGPPGLPSPNGPLGTSFSVGDSSSEVSSVVSLAQTHVPTPLASPPAPASASTPGLMSGSSSGGGLAVSRKRMYPLSRRNSSVWLATMSMDVHHMQRTPGNSHSASQMSLAGAGASLMPMSVLPRIGKPNLDNLPMELLTMILQYVGNREFGPEHIYRVLSTCGSLYDVGVAALYRHVIFRYPHTFDKFRTSIAETGYGQHVRVMDFSSFTSVGLGRTSRMNTEIQMVTGDTILRALELCPSLNEFLAAESIDVDLSPSVLDKLLTMPMVDALDFCGATNPPFVFGIERSLFMAQDFPLWNLQRLCLHCCSTISSQALTNVLCKLVNVTRLDLTHTQVTEEGLMALPQTAKLTHLSLARCVRLTSHAIVKFLVLHPATKKLRWLSLMYESTKPTPLTRHDFDTIMRFLPSTIRHLDISGLPVTEQHLYMIHLEGLRSLSIRRADISLNALQRFLQVCPRLKYIDLSGIGAITSWSVQDRALLNANEVVEMFEISRDIIERLKAVHIPGFVVNPGRGRRGWLHRIKPQSDPIPAEEQVNQRPGRAFSFAQHAIDRMNKAKQGQGQATPAPAAGTGTSAPARPPPPWDPVWRFASHKINVSSIGIGGVSTPAVFEQEGIYNYYALNSI